MKVACVVGAAGGLGVAFVQACLEDGYRVFAADLKETEPLAGFRGQHAEGVQFKKMDVTSQADVDAFGAWVEREAGQVDLLVNALGVYTKNSTLELEELDIDASLKMYDVNALGPLRIVKTLLPLILKGGEKVVVNISSEAASMAASAQMTSRYDYGMSKAALNLQTTVLQRQYGPKGVKFLLVHPGWLRTDMGRFSGGNPDVEPMDSARGVLKLAMEQRGRVHDWMYYDYNGTPRPW